MKKQLLIAALPVVALLATAAVFRQNNSIQIDSRSAAEVKLKANTVGTAQTGAWIVCADTNGTKFSLPATGIVPIAYGGTGAATAAAARAALGVSESVTNSVQPASANLTNWSAIATSTKQDASANLTNWSALATSTKQPASAALTNLAALTGVTTNFAVIIPNSATNWMQFSNGLLTNIATSTP
jgi:hypothetical protein